MSNIEVEIDTKEFKDKLGIKDIDLTPIVKSISVLEKAIKDNKFKQKDSSEIEKTLKLILEKKEDNTEVIAAIKGLALLVPSNSSGIDYTTKFNQLMDTITSSNQLRAGYNPYNPQLRNIEGQEINPSTSEKQDEIKTAIENINLDTSTLVEWVSSNLDMTDNTYYYFLSFIPTTTKWRINRLNKTSYVSDYATGESSISTAWTDRATQTYATIY